MTIAPWDKLKQIEIQLTDLAVNGDTPSPSELYEFRKLIQACQTAPDSGEAICFQGSSALLAQFEGDVQLALHHRDIETKMIERLYELEVQNPTAGWALQNYGDEDIEKREAIVLHLQQEST